MDDDEIIRDMATKLLRRFGLEVVCAVDGEEMVQKYREARDSSRPFSIVVMDLTVPGGMGGLPALAKLKEIDPHVKAIVSSGYSSDPVLANYRSHGFCAVISKPYDIHDFSRVLRDALGN
jgi:CheY-like chemotaxis protein